MSVDNNYVDTYNYMMNKISTETEDLKRRIMCSLSVGDEVLGKSPRLAGKRLKIFAFDYNHNLIGCSYKEKNSAGDKIKGRCWVSPLDLTKINEGPTYTPYNKVPPRAFIPSPKRIIVNEDSKVTVVMWDDGTKTIVKCSEADQYDSYAAYCAAFAKKCYGTNSQLKKAIENHTVVQEKKKDTTVVHELTEEEKARGISINDIVKRFYGTD